MGTTLSGCGRKQRRVGGRVGTGQVWAPAPFPAVVEPVACPVWLFAACTWGQAVFLPSQSPSRKLPAGASQGAVGSWQRKERWLFTQGPQAHSRQLSQPAVSGEECWDCRPTSLRHCWEKLAWPENRMGRRPDRTLGLRPRLSCFQWEKRKETVLGVAVRSVLREVAVCTCPSSGHARPVSTGGLVPWQNRFQEGGPHPRSWRAGGSGLGREAGSVFQGIPSQ